MRGNSDIVGESGFRRADNANQGDSYVRELRFKRRARHACMQERELDSVTGGNIGYPGLPLGTNINVSPWGLTTPFDLQWALVGATGTLPR